MTSNWSTKCTRRFYVICAMITFGYPHDAFAGKGKMTQGPNGTVEVSTHVHIGFAPTAGDIASITEKLRRSARMICDATDGKVLLNEIYLERNGMSANTADVFWLPDWQISTFITSSGGNPYGHAAAHIRVANQVAFRAVAHEFGHLLFGLQDQYEQQRRWNSGCGIGPSIQESDMTETNHSIMQQYDTYCRNKVSGIPGITKCNDDHGCDVLTEVCSEFTPLASEFNTSINNGTFESVTGYDGIDWPGILPGEKLWLDSRLFVNLTGNWTWADRSIEYIDSVGNLTLQSSHRIWLQARKVSADTYELRAYMGPSTKDVVQLGWTVDSVDTDTLTLEFDPAAVNCGMKPDIDNSSLLEVNGSPSWTVTLDITQAQLAGDYEIATDYTGGAVQLDVSLDNVCQRNKLYPYLINIEYDMDQNTGESVEGSFIGRTAPGWQLAPSSDPVYQQLADCTRADRNHSWRGDTQRWENSDQYRLTFRSDWELIDDNLSTDWAAMGTGFPALNISPPSPIQASAATSGCTTFEPVIDDSKIEAVDSIALLIDRSGSMAETWHNEPGGDEQPKIAWARAGAHGFALAGQGDPTATPPVPSKNLWLKVAAFNHEIDLMPAYGVLTPTPPPGVSADDVDYWTNLTPYGSTAIGDAVIYAVEEMFPDPNAANAVFLLTDGESNTGASIGDAAIAAALAGIPVFISPIGTFDASTLDQLANQTGGQILPTVEADEMPATLFLMRAKMRGEDLSLLYEDSVLSKSYEQYPDEVSYDIVVEAGAERLVLLLTAKSEILNSWAVDFELSGPNSESITPESVDYVIEDDERYFYLITVPAPSAGIWTMRLEAPNTTEPPKIDPEKQLLMAHVEHEGPRCRVSTSKTQIDDDSQEVTVFAEAEWNGLVGGKAEFFGEVRHPDGSTSTFSLETDPSGTAIGTFSDYSYDGPYLVKVRCEVPSSATYARGDEDPELPDAVVPGAFERTGMAYFVLDAGIPRPIGSQSCSPNGTDTDSDGLPDACDLDIDGDDLPNSLEGSGDFDGDGKQNAYDRDADDDGEFDGMDRAPHDPIAHRRFAVGDFNGDGNEDLAWGEPTYNSSKGRAAVKYVGENTIEYWSQDTAGILETSEAGDLFGGAVVAGDFDGDGYDDLAVSAPGETFSALTNAGAVHIIYGSASGLTSVGDQYWNEDTAGILGTAEAGDKFGSRLSTGDFNCDGYLDVAPGSPDEAVGTNSAAGAVHVLYGSSGGVSSVDDLWFQGDSGVNGTSEAGDRFGDELVAGDFDGDTCDDLVIGSPFEDFGGVVDGGDAYVIYGTNTGLETSGDWTLVQGVLQHTAASNDKFSTRMWIESINEDAYDDLVIMSPGDCGGGGYKGFNYVLGSSGGLSTTNNVWYCREEK